jgi:hypothetical protein
MTKEERKRDQERESFGQNEACVEDVLGLIIKKDIILMLRKCLYSLICKLTCLRR